MKFAIFTLVKHTHHKGQYYGYAPYIRQINLWITNAEEVIVVAPKSKGVNLDDLQIPYEHSNIRLVSIPEFNVKSIAGIIKTVLYLPIMVYKMQKVMRYASHLHFRCPSNVAAIALVVQLFFPSKSKSAKYAGNWDPKSDQPIGYKFQKYLLSSTLTKRMKALVFGEWANQSKNIIPFVSASYSEKESEPYIKRRYQYPLKFVFIGSLVKGKRPLLCIKIIEALNEKGIHATLDIYGDGLLKPQIETYIESYNLQMLVKLHGNQNRESIKKALKASDFSILPSKSEGWPKAIAEAMFFGCIPVSTKISCLEWMLGHGERGILITSNLEEAVNEILSNINNEPKIRSMSLSAYEWAQQFTLERIEKDIKEVLEV